MIAKVKCIQCGYLFGFSKNGKGLANKEFDPEVLRSINLDDIYQAKANDRITFRNYEFARDSFFNHPRKMIAPYSWGDCTYIGCLRHKFPNISVAVDTVQDEMGLYQRVFGANTKNIGIITHVERDCDSFFPYHLGLSARKHEALEQKALFEKQRAYAQWNKQLCQVLSSHLDKINQAQTNEEKKKSLEYLAEFLYGTINGLKIIDRDLRTSAEEIDLLVRNESEEPYWKNLGNPLVVECKNWIKPVGAKEIRDLKGKLDSRNIKTAFLISKNGITGDDYHDARLEIRQTLATGKYIILVTEVDLREIANGLPPLESFRVSFENSFRI